MLSPYKIEKNQRIKNPEIKIKGYRKLIFFKNDNLKKLNRICEKKTLLF